REWFTSGYRDDTGVIVWDSDGSSVSTDFFPDIATRDRTQVDSWTQLSNDVIVYKYSVSSKTYEWEWSRMMKTGAYICQMNKTDVWRFYQQQRDFSFGSNVTDHNKWQVGPKIISQSQDTVFYQSPSGMTSVKLHCLAQGNPQPTYTWYREVPSQTVPEQLSSSLDPRYSVSQGRLEITRPDESKDPGTYTCMASNSLGSVLSSPIVLSYGYIAEFSNVQTSAVEAIMYMGKMITCNPPLAKPDRRFNWFKRDFNFIRPEFNPQYFISKDGNLYISEVYTSDQDEYYCMVFLAPRNGEVLAGDQPPVRISLGINLRVRGENANTYGPDIHNSFPQHFPKYPMIGDTVEIECLAYGRLPLRYSWFREDAPLNERAYMKDHNRILVLPSAGLDDRGTYTCVVDGDRNSDNKSMVLMLYATPSFPFPLQDQLVDKHSNLIWTCHSIGIPKPSYRWYVNGTLLTNTNTLGVQVFRNKLSIDKVDTRHNGMYQCEATNAYGTNRSSAELRTLFFAPSFTNRPVDSTKFGAQGGNVTIACNPEAAPRAEIKWLKNGEEVGRVLPSGALELTSLSQSQAGTYTCVATNELGEARSSCVLTVVASVVISEAPAHLEISQNETALMTCRASYDQSKLDVVYTWMFYSHAIDLTDGSDDIVHYSMPYKDTDKAGMLYIIAASYQHEGEYTCIVTSVTGTVRASAFLTVKGPPGEPGGVHVRQSQNSTYYNHNHLELWWKDGEFHGYPVTKYTIEYRNYWDSEWKVLKQDIRVEDTVLQSFPEWHGTEITEGLSPGTSYQFRVKSGNNELGYSPPSSEPYRWYTMTYDVPFYAPENVHGGGGSVGLLVIKWNPLPRSLWGGSSIHYNVHYRRQVAIGEGDKWESKEGLTDTFLHVTVGVEFYYTPYEVKVQAVNEIGKGPNSSIAIVYSAEDVPANVAPTFDNAQVLNGTAAVVSWIPIPNTREAARGTVFAYQVNYWQEPTTLCLGINEHLALFSRFYGEVSSGLIIGMIPEGHYCFNLQFLNHAGIGPKTDIYNFNLNLAPPGNYPEYVTVMSHGNDSVRLYWKGVFINPGEETIIGYKAWYWDIREDIRAAKNATFGKTFTGVLHGIERDTIYKVRVFAYSIGGDGKKSGDVFFTLGGQVQYNPATTDIFNSSPGLRWSNLWSALLLALLLVIQTSS
ncbi:contactin, partial [Biomphalaria glabrata]